MALAPRVKSVLQSTFHAAHQKHMASVKGNIASSNNVVRHSVARQLDEVSPEAAEAIAKILKLPKGALAKE